MMRSVALKFCAVPFTTVMRSRNRSGTMGISDKKEAGLSRVLEGPAC